MLATVLWTCPAFAQTCVSGSSSYTFTSFDVPNAASTRAHGINARGQIVGRYIDSSGHHHGFLLSADGTTFTTIDPNIAGFSNISKIAARGNEGVMAKAPGSAYTPGRRGQSWLKLKRPLATLDVVVTAVEYGHGKRHGLLSDYTFSVRSDEGNRLVTIGKAYSGLTDAEIADLTVLQGTYPCRSRLPARGRAHRGHGSRFQQHPALQPASEWLRAALPAHRALAT